MVFKNFVPDGDHAIPTTAEDAGPNIDSKNNVLSIGGNFTNIIVWYLSDQRIAIAVALAYFIAATALSFS